MKILIVLTSNDRLGDTGEKTGFWLEELAAPYYEFCEAGADITLSSPAGGEPPLDPRSDRPEARRMVGDIERHAFGLAGDPGIARRAPQFFNQRGACDLPRQSMFAAAGTE